MMAEIKKESKEMAVTATAMKNAIFSDELREVMVAWIIFSIHGAIFRLEIAP